MPMPATQQRNIRYSPAAERRRRTPVLTVTMVGKSSERPVKARAGSTNARNFSPADGGPMVSRRWGGNKGRLPPATRRRPSPWGAAAPRAPESGARASSRRKSWRGRERCVVTDGMALLN